MVPENSGPAAEHPVLRFVRCRKPLVSEWNVPVSTADCSLSQCPACAASALAVVVEYSEDIGVCIQCGSQFRIPWYSRLLSDASSALPQSGLDLPQFSAAVRPWKTHGTAVLFSLLINALLLLVLSFLWFQSDSGTGPLLLDAVVGSEDQEEFTEMSPLLDGVELSADSSAAEVRSMHIRVADLVQPSSSGRYALPSGVAGLAGGGSGHGAGQGIGLFRGTQTANSFAYVVDASGSMSGLRMQVVLHQLNQSINELQDHQTFFVVFFSDRSFSMLWPETVEQLIAATEMNRARVLNWANTVQPNGGTRPQRALRKALMLEPEIVFFLTDGDIPKSIGRTAKQFRKPATRINTICIGREAATTLMKEIAVESGGEFTSVR